MSRDIDQIQFDATQFNYLKLVAEGSATTAIANSPATPVEVTIYHNLGYIPSVRLWYDPETSKRWPFSGVQYSDFLGAAHNNTVTGFAYVTTTQLVIQFYNGSGSSKNVTYWYRLYYDEQEA